jgi:hypothetical protein
MMRDSDGVHDEALRQVARRLGTGAADRLDVEQTAQTVVARLRAGDAPARSPIHWMQPAWLRVAAVVVVMIGVGVVYRVLHPVVQPQVTQPDSVNLELAALLPSQLQDVIAGLDQPVEMPTVHAGEAGVEDLSEPELQSLLNAIPSIQTVED